MFKNNSYNNIVFKLLAFIFALISGGFLELGAIISIEIIFLLTIFRHYFLKNKIGLGLSFVLGSSVAFMIMVFSPTEKNRLSSVQRPGFRHLARMCLNDMHILNANIFSWRLILLVIIGLLISKMLPMNKIRINLFSIAMQIYIFISFLAIPLILDSLTTNYAYGTENNSPYRVLNFSTQFIAFYLIFLFYLIGSRIKSNIFENSVYLTFFLICVPVILIQFNSLMRPVLLRSIYYD